MRSAEGWTTGLRAGPFLEPGPACLATALPDRPGDRPASACPPATRSGPSYAKRWAGSCCSASAWAARSRGSWGCRCAPARPGGRPAPPQCCGRHRSLPARAAPASGRQRQRLAHLARAQRGGRRREAAARAGIYRDTHHNKPIELGPCKQLLTNGDRSGSSASSSRGDQHTSSGTFIAARWLGRGGD